MMKLGEINPLNVFNLRRTHHCPPHFTKVYFDTSDISLMSKPIEKQVSDWIFEHLEGRFYLGDAYLKNANSKLSLQKCAAFEIEAEASFFSLMLDKILQTNYNF